VENLKVTVVGAAGRMGSLIVQLIKEADDVSFFGAVEKEICPMPGAERTFFSSTSNIIALREIFQESDVIIDVSSTENIGERISLAVELGKALVIGTTGLSEDEKNCLRKAAEKIPCVLAPNFSVGANSIFELVARAAMLLGSEYQIEIVEAHHDQKKDAPSGTANRLAEVIAGVREQELEDVACYGRHGMGSSRPKGQIGIHSLRASDVVGEHTIIFFGRGERVELAHKVTSRVAFAEGAVRAARWVVKQKPGLYDMQDVLGLNPKKEYVADVFSVAEVASILRKSKKWVYRNMGVIPGSYKLGRRIFFDQKLFESGLKNMASHLADTAS